MAETKEQKRVRLELFKEGKKRCSEKQGCGQIKTHDEFGLSKAKWDGKASVCLLCAQKNSHRHRKENPEKSRATARKSYRENREARIAHVQQYYLDNLEAKREYKRRYNPKYYAKRQQDDPMYNRLKIGQKRAKKAGGEWENISSTELLSHWEQKGVDVEVCYYCKRTVNIDDLHLDHGIPLSKGGSHTVDNLYPAHKSCNLSKGERTAEEHLRYSKQL